MITQTSINQLSYRIVGCAIEVNKELGPGLLESVYLKCLKYLLENEGFEIKSQVPVPVIFKGVDLDCELRLDLLVNDLIIIELKAVDNMIPVYKAQLMTYLKLCDKPKGLLINFNTDNIVSQIVPMVTRKFSALPVK
jgi:GxxExxY protein